MLRGLLFVDLEPDVGAGIVSEESGSVWAADALSVDQEPWFGLVEATKGGGNGGVPGLGDEAGWEKMGERHVRQNCF